MKKWFDNRKASLDLFKEGDLVLKWDNDRSKLKKHKKFESLWFEPYLISKCIELNAFKLPKMDGWKLSILINSQHLKHYKLTWVGE